MRYLALFLTTLVFVSSCKDDERYHAPKEKMVDILTDIHFAETYSTMVNDTSLHTTNKNIDSLGKYYKSILEHHDITLEQFKSSMEWYADNTEELDSVYARVLDKMSMVESNLGAE